MPPSPYELVSFEDPPVQEVAFAIQMAEPSINLDFLTFLPRELSFDLPIRQLRDPLPRMSEPLDGEPEIQLMVPLGTALPRAWFMSPDGVLLVQAQEDRVALNWRRSGLPVDYPRYASLRPKFEELVEVSARVLGLTDGLVGDLVELTYVNELDVDRAPTLPVESVLTTVKEPVSDFLPPSEDAKWAARWLIPGSDGDPCGRLIASAEPATRQADQRDTYLLTMTAKFPGSVVGSDAILERIDLGHEWIVRGFADLTTKKMQERWGRTK